MNPIDLLVMQSGAKRKGDYLFDAHFLSAWAGFKLLKLSSCNKEMNPFNFRMLQSCLIAKKSFKKRKKKEILKVGAGYAKVIHVF